MNQLGSFVFGFVWSEKESMQQRCTVSACRSRCSNRFCLQEPMCTLISLQELIYTGTDIASLMQEIQKAQDVINKIRDMKQGQLGTALVSVLNEVRLSRTVQPSSSKLRSRKFQWGFAEPFFFTSVLFLLLSSLENCVFAHVFGTLSFCAADQQ